MDFREIYTHRAGQYHDMICAEDIDHNLSTAIFRLIRQQNRPDHEIRMLDLGSGTGRIEILLKNMDIQLTSLDASRAMLTHQKGVRSKENQNWQMVQSDFFQLPFEDKCYQVITAGWSIGHQVGWFPGGWKARVQQILQEMRRVLLPGGSIMIIETMTTGAVRPAPPNSELADYYSFLEQEWGFEQSIIKTDYQFNSVDDAVEKMEFFFGNDLAGIIRRNQWSRVPEWTGLWVNRF